MKFKMIQIDKEISDQLLGVNPSVFHMKKYLLLQTTKTIAF